MTSLTVSRTACNAGGRTAARERDARPAVVQSRRKAAAEPGSLGTNAKLKNKTLKVDQDTGEIIGLDPMETRVQRFILQSVARSLFDNKSSRLNKCLRLRAAYQDVQVWKSVEHHTTHFKGLQTCGSVWRCPVCSAKIAERRRVEILQAMESHKAAGGCVNLLTLTCPHQAKDNLADLLANQAKALNRFFNDRLVKAVFVEMGTIGKIKALEVTHGRLSPQNNGWHPHYHLLMFQGSGVDLARFDQAQMMDWQVRLYLQWAKACKGAGLGEPSFSHGLKLDDGSKADKYMAKWGLEDEMTKGHTKKALHGETPFDLLRAVLADQDDKQAAALFIEFAKTFEGKKQLTWSKGLKKLYQVADKSDELLAAEVDDKARLLGMITVDQWRDVLAVEGRAAVLSIAASSGWDAVVSYLEQIKGSGVRTSEGTRLRGGAEGPGDGA
jgi:hypothetical protein